MVLRGALLWLAVMAAATALATGAAACPSGCVCSTTRDGLHKATCSDLLELYKFSLRQKHHNINILDLSHNNITKLTHQLDRFTEVVTLDLSTNGFKEIDSFLHNSKKLVHLNLANNRVRKLTVSVLPSSISSLDLSNNLLNNVPSDLKHLKHLEHLEMEGNPLDCSCENIISRDLMLSTGILIDHVKCTSPIKFKGISWLELKTKDACRSVKASLDSEYSDVMLGDEPLHEMAADFGKYSDMLKARPSQILSELDQGQTWVAHVNPKDDDDDVAFLRAKRQERVNNINIAEGSGDNSNTENPELDETTPSNLSAAQLEDEQMLLNQGYTTLEPLEGSGDEGSGFAIKSLLDNSWQETEERDVDENEQPTTEYKELYTNPVEAFLGRGVPNDTEIPDDLKPRRPSIFGGSKDWYNSSSTSTSTTTERAINEKIQIKKDDPEFTAETKIENKPAVHRTGTYICIAIIVILLVGLIGFAIIKGQMRKRRDRGLMRQQKRDIEKASKEMVDMNKSLLGKPVQADHPTEKRANGKYELVPTHETPIKKTGNGNITANSNNLNNLDKNKSSPRDSNQNREQRPLSQVEPEEEVDHAKAPSPGTKKETGSMSSEDIFSDDEAPHTNDVTASDISRPVMNGDHNADSDYLSPSREYVPVYSPDMGRVRIKMTETPKPKTPVLVTRSRSNAGDIIITPSVNEGNRKSAT